MRQSQKNNRPRNKNARKPNTPSVNRVYESSGPEGKVRGTPQQIIEKYLSLSRDKQTSGDRVMAESFQQHAEHYIRILSAAQAAQQQRRDEREEREDRDETMDADADAESGDGDARSSGNGPGGGVADGMAVMGEGADAVDFSSGSDDLPPSRRGGGSGGEDGEGRRRVRRGPRRQRNGDDSANAQNAQGSDDGGRSDRRNADADDEGWTGGSSEAIDATS